MKDIAPISRGIIAVAAIFGVIAAAIALVLFKFGFFGSLIIGILVALITAVVLMLGWRDPAGGSQDVTPPASAASGQPAPAAAEPAAATVAEATIAEASVKESAAAETPVEVEEVAVEKAPVAETVQETAPAPKAPTTKQPAAKKKPATEKPAAKKPAAKKKPAPKKPAAEKASEPADGKPAFLSAAREGGPDDLKQIKGVGPKLEKTLHDMGIFHFDQISTWGPSEQAWMDDNLAGFKGRATRDNWVEQAKTLAAGGTTEFSSKVKKGKVY